MKEIPNLSDHDAVVAAAARVAEVRAALAKTRADLQAAGAARNSDRLNKLMLGDDDKALAAALAEIDARERMAKAKSEHCTRALTEAEQDLQQARTAAVREICELAVGHDRALHREMEDLLREYRAKVQEREDFVHAVSKAVEGAQDLSPVRREYGPDQQMVNQIDRHLRDLLPLRKKYWERGA